MGSISLLNTLYLGITQIMLIITAKLYELFPPEVQLLLRLTRLIIMSYSAA